MKYYKLKTNTFKSYVIGNRSPSPTPDQVEGDVKDKVYQTTRIVHIVIPDTSGIAFFVRMRFPIKLGMTLRISSNAIPVLRPEWQNEEVLSVSFRPRSGRGWR